MQTELHLARTYLLEKLHTAAGVIAIQHDDSDFVMVDVWTGERIIFYIIEQSISAHEIRRMMEHHTAKDWHTLLIFWADMLLPRDGELYPPQDWMDVLLPLYGGKIYGFDVFDDREIYLFPVYFQQNIGQRERLIKYGRTVDFDQLRFEAVHTEYQPIQGIWKIGYFGFGDTQAEESDTNDKPAFRGVRTTMQVYYELLGIELDADVDTIKKAYHDRARLYHPDLNSDEEAHAMMQKINEAYTNILKKFD